MLDRVVEVLGEERASRFHSHFSHIEFTPKGGELRHLCFSDEGSGPEFGPTGGGGGPPGLESHLYL